MSEITVTANINTTIVKRGETRTVEATPRILSLLDSGVLLRAGDDVLPTEPEPLGGGWYLMPDGTKQRGLESDA